MNLNETLPLGKIGIIETVAHESHVNKLIGMSDCMQSKNEWHTTTSIGYSSVLMKELQANGNPFHSFDVNHSVFFASLIPFFSVDCSRVWSRLPYQSKPDET